ncbi:MAG: hypothetical protein H6705_00455 [Myxococcales bacterium]|nr:hypothetical protein [Myxococcales bacterium]
MNETEGEDSTAARTGLWLGPALAMGVLLLPTGDGLTPSPRTGSRRSPRSWRRGG